MAGCLKTIIVTMVNCIYNFLSRNVSTNQMAACHYVTAYRYEDIKADILGTVRKMLDFLRFHYDPRELEERMSRDYGTFKRCVCVHVCVCAYVTWLTVLLCRSHCSNYRKHNDDFQHFTPNQRTKIRNAISETVAYLKTNHHDNSLGVETYLQ